MKSLAGLTYFGWTIAYRLYAKLKVAALPSWSSLLVSAMSSTASQHRVLKMVLTLCDRHMFNFIIAKGILMFYIIWGICVKIMLRAKINSIAKSSSWWSQEGVVDGWHRVWATRTRDVTQSGGLWCSRNTVSQITHAKECVKFISFFFTV